jgi:hypothetical protein
MGHGKRARKDSTGFPVLFLAIAEKERIRGTVTVPQLAALTHKTTLQGSIVGHMGSAADDEIIGNDAVSNNHRRGLIADDTAIP